MMRGSMLLALLFALCVITACKTPDPMPTGPYVEATPAPAPAPETVVVGVPYPQPVAGQARPLPKEEPTEGAKEEAAKEKKDTHEVIDEANASARRTPTPDGYFNANQIYDFMPGTLYQVYGAPNHLTVISFAPGEQIYSYAAGDTLRWQVDKTFSGQGDMRRLHLLVQPTRKSLHTTMVVTTSMGTYHFELKSYQHTWMAGISFNYPRQKLVEMASQHASPLQDSQGGGSAQVGGVAGAPAMSVDLSRVEDRYHFILKSKRDRPSWMPRGVFHDGKRTFIDFGEELGEKELPALFVYSKSKDAKITQYHVHGRYIIVGEVVEFGILRLGKREDGEEVGFELKKEARR